MTATRGRFQRACLARLPTLVLALCAIAGGCDGCFLTEPGYGCGFEERGDCAPCRSHSDCGGSPYTCESGTCVSCGRSAECRHSICPRVIPPDGGPIPDGGPDGGPRPLDGGPPPECAPDIDACWAGCISANTPISVCDCPVEDGFGCYSLCLEGGHPPTTCAGYCGTATGPSRYGCARVCQTTGETTRSCRGTCRLDGECGELGCAETCIANEDTLDDCAFVCGFDTEIGAGACYLACVTLGESADACTTRCDSSTDGCVFACSASGVTSGECLTRCGVPVVDADAGVAIDAAAP